MSRRHAYHEAGHAAVALRLGVGVREVTIRPPTSDIELGFGGTCRLDVGDGYATTTQAIEDHLTITLCGPVAEARINHIGLTTALTSTGRHDLDTAMRYIAGLGRAARPFADYITLARVLVSDEWSAFERIARALRERGTLDGAAILDLARRDA